MTAISEQNLRRELDEIEKKTGCKTFLNGPSNDNNGTLPNWGATCSCSDTFSSGMGTCLDMVAELKSTYRVCDFDLSGANQ